MQIASLQKLGQDAGTLEDQRTELMKKLSALTDIAVITSDQGYTITTSNGSPLVVAGQCYTLQTSPDAAGMQHIYSAGQDITSTIQGGQIGGLITVRDQNHSANPDFARQPGWRPRHQLQYGPPGGIRSRGQCRTRFL